MYVKAWISYCGRYVIGLGVDQEPPKSTKQEIIHDVEGVVFLVMNDNVTVNQKLFKLLQQDFHKETLSVIYRPFENSFLSLAFDPPRNSYGRCSIKKGHFTGKRLC